MDPVDCRILSIQSHVISGYVGNKSATFPLQVLGFEVDPINSVQFSNHTRYNSWEGQILDAGELKALYHGLKNNDLCHYSHLLTGYIGSESFLNQVRDVICDLKKQNPNLIYVCDPVMGDEGKLYVKKELLPIYQKCIIPHADILTPNQFEAELLSGLTITDLDTARQAMDRLHEMGAKTVLITSTNLGDDDHLLCVGSTVINDSKTCLKINIPKIPAHFTGTGDLFAALLLAWLHRHNNDLKTAVEKTVATMQCVLKRTYARAKKLATSSALSAGQIELQLVQSKHDLESPEICCSAEII